MYLFSFSLSLSFSPTPLSPSAMTRGLSASQEEEASHQKPNPAGNLILDFLASRMVWKQMSVVEVPPTPAHHPHSPTVVLCYDSPTPAA